MSRITGSLLADRGRARDWSPSVSLGVMAPPDQGSIGRIRPLDPAGQAHPGATTGRNRARWPWWTAGRLRARVFLRPRSWRRPTRTRTAAFRRGGGQGRRTVRPRRRQGEEGLARRGGTPGCDQPADRPAAGLRSRRRPARAHRPGFGPGMFLAPQVMELADANKDGRLTPEEAAKAAEQVHPRRRQGQERLARWGGLASAMNRRMGPPPASAGRAVPWAGIASSSSNSTRTPMAG